MNAYQKTVSKKKRLLVTVMMLGTLLLLILPLATRLHVRRGVEYTGRDEVALYILKYGTLPGNYRYTAGEAEAAFGTATLPPADGAYIGGDAYPYEGAITQLTRTTDLRICDIAYAGTAGRGGMRLVYAADGSEVYYTSDLGASFREITELSVQKVSNLFWVVFGIFVFLETLLTVSLMKLHLMTAYELTANVRTVWHLLVAVVSLALALVGYFASGILRFVFHTVFFTAGLILSLIVTLFTLPVEAIQNRRALREEAAYEALHAAPGKDPVR